MYLYPSLLKGCSSGYPWAGSFGVDKSDPRPFFPGPAPLPSPGNLRLALRPRIPGVTGAKNFITLVNYTLQGHNDVSVSEK